MKPMFEIIETIKLKFPGHLIRRSGHRLGGGSFFRSKKDQLPLKNVREYFYYLFREFYKKRTLFDTFIIGLGISAFSESFHLPAFAIPFLVLSASRAVTNFRNRHVSMLLQLPSQREDPTFITHKKTLCIMADGSPDESPGKQWYGDKLWSVFLDHHKKFQETYDSKSF
jgi:hypothetical protein